MVGDHPAPRSRDMLRDYRYFCLDHVRVYNSKWNYFEGMTDAEVEAHLRRDTVWDRPTWPLGENDDHVRRGPKHGHGAFGYDPQYFKDTFGFFADEDEAGANAGPRPDPTTREALAILGLQLPVTPDNLKAKYKDLVKKHHPDANNGDKAAEERFKEIRQAYDTLRQFLVM